MMKIVVKTLDPELTLKPKNNDFKNPVMPVTPAVLDADQSLISGDLPSSAEPPQAFSSAIVKRLNPFFYTTFYHQFFHKN